MRASDLADVVASTPQFVPQVMNPLVRAGWVVSESGPTGGYALAAPLSDRSVLELIELIEGRTDTGSCVLRGGPCSGMTQCALHDAWAEARAALTERLAAMSVSAGDHTGGLER